MWYSTDMFHYMFQAEFVMRRFKSPVGRSGLYFSTVQYYYSRAHLNSTCLYYSTKCSYLSGVDCRLPRFLSHTRLPLLACQYYVARLAVGKQRPVQKLIPFLKKKYCSCVILCWRTTC